MLLKIYAHIFTRQVFNGLFLALLASGMIGCAAAGGSALPQMILDVNPAPKANNGQPFHLVVRAVDPQTFLTEGYREVAVKVYALPPDPSLMTAVPILPGNRETVFLEQPKEGGIGVYCMFTEPGERWKILLNPPLHARYSISIKESRIIETERVFHRKKGLLERIFSSDEETEESDG